MNQRPKVLLLIPHLGGGGAEKVFALLAQGLSCEKYDLHLALITQPAPPAGRFPSCVTIHGLGATRVRSAAPALLRLIRRLRPLLIVSGMFHLNFLVLLLRPFFPPSTRVLVRQNGAVSASIAFDRLPFYTGPLYRLLYRRADRIICQSAAMAADIGRELGIRGKRLSVLPNPIDVDAIRASLTGAPIPFSGPGPHLLAVGRLSPEKGFDLLLEALAKVRHQLPSADLVLVGTGPAEALLKAQSRALGLESAVHFTGHIDQPSLYFPGASIFVLSSRHEGMPNALLEAAAAGLPIVALPASGGIASLLAGLPGVWLASEISAAALAESLPSALAALQPAERFPHPFVEQFRIDRALHAYEDLFDAVLTKARP